MRIAHHTITWGGVTAHPAGVTSIKDLFYLSAGSVTDAVRQIGAVGYQGTEVFDGNLAALADDPGAEAAFRGALSDTGVELVSVYTGANFVYADALPDELHRITRSCELAASFGARRLVVGGGARRSTGTLDADYDALAAGLDRVVDLATGTWVPLGQGDLDIGGVISAVRGTGYDSWLVVELDSTPGDPRDAAAASHVHLTQLLAGLDA